MSAQSSLPEVAPTAEATVATPVAQTAQTRAPESPRPTFEVLGAQAVPFTAVPTLVFTLRVRDPTERPIYTIALTCQVNLEPAERSYDDATRSRLVELFGEPERWSATARSMMWVKRDVLVPSFSGETTFELQVACGNDLELAAEKYFSSLPGGEAPLTFLFNGTIFYEEEGGRMQLVQVPWECVAKYRLPVATWRSLIASHYQDSVWIRLGAATVDRLARYKAERGLLSFDHCLDRLLEEVEAAAPAGRAGEKR